MKKETRALSVRLVEGYYDNDRRLFFDLMDDDVIWIGPGVKQRLEGKKNLVKAFAKEESDLRFRIEGLTAQTVYASVSVAEVLLTYLIYTYYPNGHILVYQQRVSLLWRKVEVGGAKKWRYLLMHISNGMETDERDFIYPLHLDEFEIEHGRLDFSDIDQRPLRRLVIKGDDRQTHYLEFANILLISGGKGRSSEIHTKYGDVKVGRMLSELAKALPKEFYRYHRSHIVNIYAIASIGRNRLTLVDKTEIPVPEKKFSKVKKEIGRLLLSLGKGEDHPPLRKIAEGSGRQI